MLSKKIEKEEIEEMKISSLPTRPTASKAFGGKGLSPGEMKAAFDRLPLFLVERFNELMDDITRDGQESISAAIPSGIEEGHSLYDMMQDVKKGVFAEYLTINGTSLSEAIESIKNDIETIKGRNGES